MLQTLTPAEIKALCDNISAFSPDEQEEILRIADELNKRKLLAECQTSLLAFCKYIDPNYLVAAHHRKLAALLEDIAYGQKDRITVSIPPRFGKSHLISTLFPAWFLGKFPDKKVLMASHTADLAVDFGRKVRNIIASSEYQSVFPGTSLSADSKSAGRWSTNKGGEFFATGVGSALAGRGADILLIDDPHSEQDILAGNFDALAKAYQWFMSGARTRLMSKGRIAVVHCMTGDTPVLMANQKEKPLCDVRVGDMVASYEKGKLIPARVLNWANQGLDCILTIKMTSGKILRANERHPFLVDFDGEQRWVKVKDLKVGMSLVGACQSQTDSIQKPEKSGRLQQRIKNAVSMNALMPRIPLENVSTTTTKIVEKQKLSHDPITGVSGEELVVHLKDVQNLPTLKDSVRHTTTRQNGLQESTNVVPRRAEMHILSTATESLLMSTTECSLSKRVSALFVDGHQDQITPPQIGKGSSGLITVTMDSESEHYCAMHVTLSSAKVTQKKPSYELLNTYAPILDQITSIFPSGMEEVFDIQVEGTENFIANGLVSHNTRWHQDDLIGNLIRDGAKNPDADQYEVFEFPAILSIPQPSPPNADGTPGPPLPPIQKSLWPEKFDLQALARTKASMPTYQWNAQYMQSPTAEEAALVKREWWRPWTQDDPPKCEYIIMTLDAAAEKHNRADFTALATWGVFAHDELTDGANHLILLNCINVRVEFPELKDLLLREYKEWEPEALVVEKKSAGTQLYQEMRRLGIPVQEFTPTRATGDKVARLNAVSDILRSGMVWFPQGRRWAEELIEQCVAFPYGSNDDMVDVTTMALARFRQGGFIALSTDFKDEPLYVHRRVGYY